jgi:hypothetical protein
MDEDLQFQKAEYAGEAASPSEPSAAPALAIPPAPVNLAQGLLFALGAAVACSIAYAAIVIVSKYELALVSIAVGYLIGTAAVKGAGNGSRMLQIAATVLTYISICASLFFTALWELSQQGKVYDVVGYGAMLVMSMGKPLFEINEGVGGILGIAILVFGLMQAWKQAAPRGI